MSWSAANQSRALIAAYLIAVQIWKFVFYIRVRYLTNILIIDFIPFYANEFTICKIRSHWIFINFLQMGFCDNQEFNKFYSNISAFSIYLELKYNQFMQMRPSHHFLSFTFHFVFHGIMDKDHVRQYYQYKLLKKLISWNQFS